MTADNHLFLEALEQMKDLLRSPALESRAKDPFVTKTILEFYELIDAYAKNQTNGSDDPKQSEQLKLLYADLGSKINTIESHVNVGLDKLKFLSEVKPKN